MEYRGETYEGPLWAKAIQMHKHLETAQRVATRAIDLYGPRSYEYGKAVQLRHNVQVALDIMIVEAKEETVITTASYGSDYGGLSPARKKEGSVWRKVRSFFKRA